jgi:hypothetical protein
VFGGRTVERDPSSVGVLGAKARDDERGDEKESGEGRLRHDRRPGV